jgi:hypothetical protein
LGTKREQVSLNRLVNLEVVVPFGDACERVSPHEQKFKNQDSQSKPVVVTSPLQSRIAVLVNPCLKFRCSPKRRAHIAKKVAVPVADLVRIAINQPHQTVARYEQVFLVHIRHQYPVFMQRIECGGAVPCGVDQKIPGSGGKFHLAVSWAVKLVNFLPLYAGHQETPDSAPLIARKQQAPWQSSDG